MNSPLVVYDEGLGRKSSQDTPVGNDGSRSCIGPVVDDIQSHGNLLHPVQEAFDDSQEAEICQLKALAVQALVKGGPDAAQRQEMRNWLDQVDCGSKQMKVKDVYRAVYCQGGEACDRGSKASDTAMYHSIILFPREVSVGLKVAISDLAFNLHQMVICHTAHASAEAMLDATTPSSDAEHGIYRDSKLVEKYRREAIQNAGREVGLDALFHEYIALVCCEACAFAYSDHDTRFAGGFPLLLKRSGQGGGMAEFLIGLDWLIRSFGEDGWACQYLNEGLEMPKILLGYLYIIRDRILEQGIFGHGSSWYERATRAQSAMEASMVPPGDDDFRICTYCVRHFASMMESRSRVLVNNLSFGNVFLECSWRKKERMSKSITAAVLKLLDTILHDHFGIVFYTHATAIILSSIFCTAKLANVPVRFSDLEMVASTCFPLHTKNDFRQIGVEGIDLRQFYNTVFLAAVSSYSEHDLFGETLLACKNAQLEAPEPKDHMAE